MAHRHPVACWLTSEALTMNGMLRAPAVVVTRAAASSAVLRAMNVLFLCVLCYVDLHTVQSAPVAPVTVAAS